jgi:hypothetical protein
MELILTPIRDPSSIGARVGIYVNPISVAIMKYQSYSLIELLSEMTLVQSDAYKNTDEFRLLAEMEHIKLRSSQQGRVFCIRAAQDKITLSTPYNALALIKPTN